MFGSSVRGAAAVAIALAALTVSCSAGTTPKPGTPVGAPTQAASALPPIPSDPTDASATGPATEPDSDPVTALATPAAEAVRDAFAGLQATLGESCTPGDCAYHLGRVYDELQGMDRAMKADPQGPGHFPEPIELIKKLNAELGGDSSAENLAKHQTTLIATRDKINTWMQGHPEDYR